MVTRRKRSPNPGHTLVVRPGLGLVGVAGGAAARLRRVGDGGLDLRLVGGAVGARLYVGACVLRRRRWRSVTTSNLSKSTRKITSNSGLLVHSRGRGRAGRFLGQLPPVNRAAVAATEPSGLAVVDHVHAAPSRLPSF